MSDEEKTIEAIPTSATHPDNKLAILMIKWLEARATIDYIEAAIAALVEEKGATVDVGRCRATYKNESTTYDYEAAVLAIPTSAEKTAAILENTKPGKPNTAWKKVYEALGLTEAPVKNFTPAKVEVKLIQ